jgi:hypothetical protein
MTPMSIFSTLYDDVGLFEVGRSATDRALYTLCTNVDRRRATMLCNSVSSRAAKCSASQILGSGARICGGCCECAGVIETSPQTSTAGDDREMHVA